MFTPHCGEEPVQPLHHKDITSTKPQLLWPSYAKLRVLGGTSGSFPSRDNSRAVGATVQTQGIRRVPAHMGAVLKQGSLAGCEIADSQLRDALPHPVQAARYPLYQGHDASLKSNDSSATFFCLLLFCFQELGYTQLIADSLQKNSQLVAAQRLEPMGGSPELCQIS